MSLSALSGSPVACYSATGVFESIFTKSSMVAFNCVVASPARTEQGAKIMHKTNASRPTKLIDLM